MKILILGLGLIGGSMARALKFFTENAVDGYDPNPESVRLALVSGAVERGFTEMPRLAEYELIIPASYPQITVDFLENHASEIAPGTLVIDLGGTKRRICEVGFRLAREHGFTFIGGHPMAGTQFSGFAASRENLFKGATMLLVPPENMDEATLERVTALFTAVGFGRVKLTDAATHDRIIAFTSQLPHIISASYAKSPTSAEHEGFSAGSYRDLTRVAKLNEAMWGDLFMENRDFLVAEVERMASSMLAVAESLKKGDLDATIAELHID